MVTNLDTIFTLPQLVAKLATSQQASFKSLANLARLFNFVPWWDEVTAEEINPIMGRISTLTSAQLGRKLF